MVTSPTLPPSAEAAARFCFPEAVDLFLKKDNGFLNSVRAARLPGAGRAILWSVGRRRHHHHHPHLGVGGNRNEEAVTRAMIQIWNRKRPIIPLCL